ncbi:MAG: TrkH family potassium uptake protein [Spirochaetota bacterium]|nr:TrkH family potassium uptake protein [Spirochaetota bacterium]
MDQGERKLNRLIISTLLLSIVSLFIEQMDFPSGIFLVITNLLDFVILYLLISEVIFEFKLAVYKTIYIRKNIFSLIFVAVFVLLFIYNKILLLTSIGQESSSTAMMILIIRNLFLLLKVLTRFKRLASLLENIHVHPAQTIFMSFLLVILGGTLLLMMPFTAVEGSGLSFLDALFTSTSAVCVTGLIVVDTALYFSIWGKIIILILIQIGGLGIMILSYFTVFVLRRSMSVEDKVLISYMLSDADMSSISRTLKSIIGITFLIEGIGAFVLLIGFIKNTSLSVGSSVFYSIFHSVSAFCNAGFALFTDSLEGFNSSFLVTGGVAVLIIMGGISFSVIANLKSVVHAHLNRKRKKGSGLIPPITLNTRIVLFLSAFLLLSGTFLFYTIEHSGTLKNMGLGSQYLSAFFQSVTLRTAGFNTVRFGSLSTSMLIAMMIFMFIGAASGSTAGGIKINTVAVLGAAVKSAWKNEKDVVLLKKSISSDLVTKAFMILLFGVVAVMLGTFFISVTENAPMENIMFEVVSAFGTVGLSTGLTPMLSGSGRFVIIILMFIGRLGPLTVLAAASTGGRRINVKYPQADISIG